MIFDKEKLLSVLRQDQRCRADEVDRAGRHAYDGPRLARCTSLAVVVRRRKPLRRCSPIAGWRCSNASVGLGRDAGGVGHVADVAARRTKGRGLGALLGVIALGLFRLATVAAVGDWSGEVVFCILAAVTVVSAVCTVTFRSPVYCAIWFALTLLGTAAIFMLQGAQFLGVATIVVYAGAILVTFLFVLMLAQPRGNAFYDRVSWEALLGRRRPGR